jgi:hypothetical protein
MTVIELLDRFLIFLVATVLALTSLIFVILPASVLLLVLFIGILIYEKTKELFS